MPIFNASNQSLNYIVGTIQGSLLNLRNSLEAVNDLYSWISGISASDLEAAPFNMDSADASALLSAVADAHALYLISTTGQPPSTYPQAASAYVYSASQTQIIGVAH